jgi:hypothetical protein
VWLFVDLSRERLRALDPMHTRFRARLAWIARAIRFPQRGALRASSTLEYSYFTVYGQQFLHFEYLVRGTNPLPQSTSLPSSPALTSCPLGSTA